MKIKIMLAALGIALGATAFANQKTIGVTTITLQHQFFIEMDEGIKEQAKKENIKVLVNDPNQDAARQTAAIEDFIQKKVDGMIVIGTDNTAVVPAVEEAYAKMPVITIDAVLNTDKITSHIGTINEQAGFELGEHLKKYIDENLNGKAKIGIVTFLESQIQQERITGLKRALKDSKDIVFLNPQPGYNREQALSTTENILQANSDLDIIFATAENSVLGAKAALESAKNTKTKIVGFDLTEESADGIKNGMIVGMVQQQPKEMGRLAVEMLVKSMKNEKIDKNIPVPVLLFDKTNIDNFKK